MNRPRAAQQYRPRQSPPAGVRARRAPHVITFSSGKGLSDNEAAAYAAPFPGRKFRAGVRRFPELVMTEPDMEGVDISKRAAKWFGSRWHGDSFMAVGMKDILITPQLMERMREILCVSRAPLLLPETGHFVQENGDIVARAALAAWSH